MLEIRSPGKRYPGGTVGLQDFSLEAGGGVLGLLGPNGAGKTTLMTILATVTRPLEDPSAARSVLYLAAGMAAVGAARLRERLRAA